MPTFKVPCPSCEAPVLIKDPKLVGTKVECPKCKYRFKVEEPAADAADPKKGDAKDKKADAKDKKADAKKAKTAGKNKKLVPILVGAGAVVLIIVVGVFAFGGKKKTPPGGGGGGGGTVRTGSGGDTPPEGDGTTGGGPVTPAGPPPVPPSKINTTHLLPGQAVAVYRFNMDRVRESPLHTALADGQVRPLFQKSMGFEVDDVETYLHCFSGPDRDPFGVIKLKNPTKTAETLAAMRSNLDAKAKKVKTRDLYPVRVNPFVDAVSHALAMRSLLSEVYDGAPAAPASSGKPMAVCVYDTQHILIGDAALLEKFLGELDADGYPPFKTALILPTPEPTGMPTPMDGMPPATPPATPPAPPPPAPVTADRSSTTDSYRTIEFNLKRLLDLMEADKTLAPMFVYAEKFDIKQYDPTRIKSDYQMLRDAVGPIAARTTYVSANVVLFSQRQLFANLRIRFQANEDARAAAKEHLVPGMTGISAVLKLLLQVSVEFRDATKDGTASTPAFGPGGIPGMGGIGMGPMPGMSSLGPMPGGMGIGPAPMPGSFGPPRPGGGGPSGSVFPPTGAAGGPGRPGLGGPSGPVGPPGGFGPRPMGQPGGMGDPDAGGMGGGAGQPGAGDPNAMDPGTLSPSHLDLVMTDNELLITIDLSWSETVYRTTVAPRLVSMTNQIKGKMAVFSSGEFAWQVTAGVGPKAVTEKKAFPRGTADRKTNIDRYGLEYPAGTRVSLFADLLPYMGRGELARTLNPKLAWYDPANLPTPGSDRAGAWVPELLVPDYPQSAWRAVSPLAPDHVLGATNYVAIAGTGLTIARENPANPAFAKKVGITGYGWGSKAEEVTDGLANTIYMMQTPPGLQQPWIAGGGATVRGFDETNPMAAFTYAGRAKAGSYALMGDGSVRFIPANIDPKVLLAMGTRAGGEKLADIDTHTQKLEPPKPPEPEPKKEDPPAPEKKDEDKKPADAKPEDKKPADAKKDEPKKDADPKGKAEAPPPGK